jgi:regulator of protease activity HflC (stomatin/prohibitin superfamily)
MKGPGYNLSPLDEWRRKTRAEEALAKRRQDASWALMEHGLQVAKEAAGGVPPAPVESNTEEVSMRESDGISGAKIALYVSSAVVLLVVFILGGCSISCVPNGHVGVIDTFGSVSDRTLPAGGPYLVNPFSRVVKLSMQLMETKEEDFSVTTKEGLSVSLDLSVWYSLKDPVSVYKNIGPEFTEKIVHPAIRGVVRDAISRYGCEQLYDISSRQLAAKEARDLLDAAVVSKGLDVDQILLRDITFPEQVKKAIDSKMAMKQAAEQMEFVLLKEKQEAERKRVEAGGIADAQNIIAEKLTEQYLQWKYIETLHGLIGSPNTSTLIMPFDQKLTPMVQLPAGK